MTDTTPLSSSVQTQWDNLFNSYIDKGLIAGFQVLVQNNKKQLLRREWGSYSFEGNEPVRPDTIWRIFSMTKPITMVAFFQLWEQGRVQLDTPLKEYFPEFGDMEVFDFHGGTEKAVRDITLRHLLTMTAGFTYGFFPEKDALDYLYEDRGQSLKIDWRNTASADFLKNLASLPLAFQPGDSFRYSFGHDVIGCIIEDVTGMMLGDYFRANILQPLGMDETGFHVPEEKRNRIPALYEVKPEEGIIELQPVHSDWPCLPPRFHMGGSGLYSTIDDYSRFCRFLMEDGAFEGKRLLKEDTLKMIRTNQLNESQHAAFQREWPGYGYGYGVRVLETPPKAGILASPGEFGWDGAASTWMFVDPVKDISGIMMCQMIPGRYYPVHREFMNLVYKTLI